MGSHSFVLPSVGVDLVSAARRSKGVLAALSSDVLERIEQRYRMYLALKVKYPQAPIAPTGLIDEMWHLHMLHPRAYAADCERLFGEILDHDPGFGLGEGERVELDRTFARTAFLWEAEFGLPYVDPSITGDDRAMPLHGVVMCDDKSSRKEPAKPAKPKGPKKPPAKPKKARALASCGIGGSAGH